MLRKTCARLVLTLCLGLTGPVLAQTPPPPSTQVPQQVNKTKGFDTKPVGFALMPDPQLTLQRLVQMQHSLAPQLNAMLAQQIPALRQKLSSAPKNAAFFRKQMPAVFQMDPNQALATLPTLFQQAGLDTKRPAGVGVWFHKRSLLTAVIVPIHTYRFLRMVRFLLPQLSARLQFRTFPDIGETRLLLGQESNGKQHCWGVLRGGYLYLLPDSKGQREFPFKANSPYQLLVDYLITSTGTPLSGFVQHSPHPGLAQQLKQKNYDLVASSASLASAQNMPKVKRMLDYLRGLSMTLSLKNLALRWQDHIHFTPKAQAYLGLLQAEAKPSFQAYVPGPTKLFGQMRIAPSSLASIFQTLRRQGVLPAQRLMQLTMGWYMVSMQARAMGIDIPVLLSGLTGQYASGMLWGSDMPARIALWTKNRGLPGNLEGVFLMLGTKHPNTATQWVKSLHIAYGMLQKRFAQRIKRMGLQLTLQQLPGKDGKSHTALEIKLPTLAPVYLIAHEKFLLFAGAKSTRDAFLATWAGKKPDLMTSSRSFPQFHRFLQRKGNFFVFHPQTIWDTVQAQLKNQRRSSKAQLAMMSTVLNKLGIIGFYSSASPTMWKTGILVRSVAKSPIDKRPALTPSPAPMGKRPMQPMAMGLAASSMVFSLPMIMTISTIAIPAFLRFVRKSKTSEAALNITALVHGARAWYNDEHADSMGNPIPKQFPCTGKGWICSPTKRPCANGNPKYSKNLKVWDRSCWRQLKFGIVKSHYYQYCYKAEGIGKAAKFWVRAHGDLDCDRIRSTYEVRGTVSPSTGEVERTNTIVTNGLE